MDTASRSDSPGGGGRATGGRICSLCEAALDHCHGTLIVHADLAVECTEPDCDALDQARHPRLADCADIIGGCACDPRGVEMVIEVVEIREEGHRSLTG